MIVPSASIVMLKGYSNIKSIRPVIATAGQSDSQVFPNNPRFKWNLDNFGPLKLPQRGINIPLNDSTLLLYRQAIEK